MQPLKDHLDPPCLACGVGTRVPCAGDRTCTKRIWRAINRWFAEYHQWVRQTPCPLLSCSAQAGEECEYADMQVDRLDSTYGLPSHLNRIRLAEKWSRVA